MNPLTQSKNTTILPVFIALTLGCFGLSPQARAVCQEGCLTNGNTVLGDDALINNTTGSSNTAIGSSALVSNTTGSLNTGIGSNALDSNTTGSFNTGIGTNALVSNTTGSSNTATGLGALFLNTTGDWNTAIGDAALLENTTGSANTAIGRVALLGNTTGHSNTAIGFQALISNTTGTSNTADGFGALFRNTTGGSNIALGYFAGENLTTGNNNIDIGNLGVAGESNTIRVGTVGTQTNAYIAGIRDTPLAHGAAVAVGITADGQLGVRASSARFKEAIKPMDKTSEAIFSLQPVTFRYKKAFDSQALPQFGLVAEQVAKVNPDLVARDAEGKPFTVRYDEVNAMLLNEFLKEHRKVQELEANDVQQQNAIKALTAMVKEQTAQIQKVSAQIGMSKPAPQVVNNP